MADWIRDPQNRDEVEKVTKNLKLPVWRASYKGRFRDFWNECWGKLEDAYNSLKQLADTKEDKFSKKSGFNLDKSDSVSSNSSSTLATSAAVKTAYDKGANAERIANTKEPIISKKSGFNLDKSDSVSSNSSSTLATSAAVKTAYDKGANAERIANTKEPIISKKSGFNLNKTDRIDFDDSNTLATAKALNVLRKKVESINVCPYNVGDIYITTNSQNPTTIWVGTTWTKIEGRFLMGTSGSGSSKQTGGSNSKTITVENMPSHNHSASTAAHSHTIQPHTHNVLTYEGGGRPGVSNYSSGWSHIGTQATTQGGGGNTGGASPTTTIGHTGGGRALDITPAYYTVHMWLRNS